ncbi:MAG: exodeoxyribonuclease VII large subunit [Thiothrix sp.]|nr:MAG: exodeoxyribonuclease VII large subunit [Thiothrix sp.]
MVEPSSGKIYSITELNSIVRGLLEIRLADIWIQGEITNLAKPASGHWYFTLKDGGAQIRCAMFRNRNRTLKFKPDNGIKVQARGRVSLYEPRGDYQFIVEECELAGEGELQRAFEQLKQRLWDEGLFDEQYKQPLPCFPKTVGIITSPTGAAIRDILSVLKRRFPLLAVIIYPVPVQGIDAAPQIVEMIKHAGSRQECDVLLLSRGGGSIEDLWAFNDETVARTIFASKTPVITGVGHEIDFTIADFVSDLRAPTPSAAAELITPLKEELQEKLGHITRILESIQSKYLNQATEKLQWLKKTLGFHHPRARIQRQVQQIDDLQLRLTNHFPRVLQQLQTRAIIAQHMLSQYSPLQKLTELQGKCTHLRQAQTKLIQTSIADCQQTHDSIHAQLTLLSPKATLDRGYAIIYDHDTGRVIKKIEELQHGNKISGNVANGEFIATIEATKQQKTNKP